MTRVAECDAQFRGGGDIPRPAGTHGRLEAEGHEAAFGEDAKRRGSEHSADPPWAGALGGRAPPSRLDTRPLSIVLPGWVPCASPGLRPEGGGAGRGAPHAGPGRSGRGGEELTPLLSAPAASRPAGCRSARL